MRFEKLYARQQRREVTRGDAAEMLGVTERTCRHWRGRYDAEDAEGLQDRRLGRASARAGPVDEALRRVTLHETRYTGWTVTHFHERWHTEHGGTRSSTWTTKTLQAAGHVARAPHRVAHRNPLPGMMLHQDGSTPEWVPGCRWDLIVTLDDATTEIYSACFVEEEGTLSRLRGLQEGIKTHGRFSSCTRTEARMTGIQRRRAAKSTRLGGRRCIVRCRSSGSRAFRPIRQRRGAGRSASSAPCKIDCPKSGPSPGSRRGRRPRSFSPPPTGALRCQPRSRHRLRPVDRHVPGRDAVCEGGAGGRQGQHRALSPPAPPDPAGSPPVPLCAGHGASPRVSGWNPGRVPRAPVSGPVSCRGRAAGDHRDDTATARATPGAPMTQ